MKFRKKWLGGYEGEGGFSIGFETGRAGMTYREGDVVVLVDSEMLMDGWVVWPARMHFGSFQEPFVEDSALRSRIVERITALFAFYSWHLEIDQG